MLVGVDALLQEHDLRGVEVVDAELPFVTAVRADIWRQAQTRLAGGLSAQNRTEVQSALQTLQALGSLAEIVEQTAARLAVEAAQTLASSFDQATFWTKLEQCFVRARLRL